MLDEVFVRRKITLITEDLAKLAYFRESSLEELSRDWVKWSALERVLMKVIGRAIDINQHLIAEMAGPGVTAPRNYQATFLRLSSLGIVPPEFAERISRSAVFRNAIVHEYNNVDHELVFATVGEAVADYAEYCQRILEFLERTAGNAPAD